MGRGRCLEKCRRQGFAIDGGTVRLLADTWHLFVHTNVSKEYKLHGNTYSLNVYSSRDEGATWQPLVTDAEHNTLGPRERPNDGKLYKKHAKAWRQRTGKHDLQEGYDEVKAAYMAEGGTFYEDERHCSWRININPEGPPLFTAGTLVRIEFDAERELELEIDVEVAGQSPVPLT